MPSVIPRADLHEVLPLASPFSLHVYPSFYCNFRCGYCLHSLDRDELERKGFRRQYMDYSLYQKAVDDVANAGWKLKALLFAGHGEPLLHRRIADMVAYAKEQDVAERTEIVTNASLLTRKLSDALIDAGLDRLRVSIQGTTSEAYRKTSGANLDFAQFVEQLRYFYEHKRNTDVYIKIIDVALNSVGDQKRFEEIFRPVADTVAIEHAIPFVPEIDLGELSGESKQGGDMHSDVCSMPFYMLVLYPNGDVLPCCSTEVPIVFGNAKQDNLAHIWHSKRHTAFLIRQLGGVKSIPVCSSCNVPSFGLQEGDRLDGYQDRLRNQYQTLREGAT